MWAILGTALAAVGLAIPVRHSTRGKWALGFGAFQTALWVLCQLFFSLVTPLPETAPATHSFGPPFVAHLQQGTVELLALAPHPSTNAPSWHPDGSPSCERFPSLSGSDSAAGKVVKEIAFRLRTHDAGSLSYPVLRCDKDAEVSGMGSSLAGEGTNQIGRLDLVVDDETNRVIDYQWQLVKIDDSLMEPDHDLENFIHSYEEQVEDKYSAMITKLRFKHTHPMREIETDLGNLFADALAEMTESEIMFLASGSIRTKELGPLVRLKDVATCFPYNEPLTRYTVTGTQLRRMFGHIMRKENRNGEGECFQVNGRVRAVYDEDLGMLRSLRVDGNEVQDDRSFKICLQPFHAKNSKAFLDITNEELKSIKPKVVTTSAREVLEEWLRNNQNCGREIEGRMKYS